MPFAGGIDSLANGTLILSIIAALLYLPKQADAPSWRRTVIKAGSIVLLAMLAYLENGPFLLIAGLALSALGDAFLAQKSEKAFLAGLGSFLSGHIAYVILFALIGSGLDIILAQSWRVILPAIALAFAVSLLRRLLPVVDAQMRLPVTAYVVAIFAMLLTSATVPPPLVMIGAAFFVASDSILAIERFMLAPSSSHRGWSGPAIWVLYYLAQICITLGFLL